MRRCEEYGIHTLGIPKYVHHQEWHVYKRKVMAVKKLREPARNPRRRAWFFGIALLGVGPLLLLAHFLLPDWDDGLLNFFHAVRDATAQWNLISPLVIIALLAMLIGGVVIANARQSPPSRSGDTSLPILPHSLPMPPTEVIITTTVVLYDIENQLINFAQAQRFSILLRQRLGGQTVLLLGFHRPNQNATKATEAALVAIGFTLFQANDDAQGAVDRRIQEEVRRLIMSQPTHTIFVTSDQGYEKAVIALHFMRHRVSIWGRNLSDRTIAKYRALNAEVEDISDEIGSSGTTRKHSRRRP
jgi:hypothetical protein